MDCSCPSYESVIGKEEVLDFNDVVINSENAYTIEEDVDPINQHLTKYNDIVSDTIFINGTNIDITIIHGGTKRAVRSRCVSYPGMSDKFIIKSSISPSNEITYTYEGNRTEVILDGKKVIGRDVTKYIIDADTLRRQPVYIEELNVVVVKTEYADRIIIPTRANQLRTLANRIKEKVKDQLFDKQVFSAYVVTPHNYTGTKTFYMVINNSIHLLPIIEDRFVTDGLPTLVILNRVGKWGEPKESRIEIDPTKILVNPRVVVDNSEYLISTNYDSLQFYLQHEDRTVDEIKRENERLKKKVKRLEEEAKFHDAQETMREKGKPTQKDWVELTKNALVVVSAIFGVIGTILACRNKNKKE